MTANSLSHGRPRRRRRFFGVGQNEIPDSDLPFGMISRVPLTSTGPPFLSFISFTVLLDGLEPTSVFSRGSVSTSSFEF